MQIVFWHNVISPHQAPVISKLTELGHEILVVATETMSADRRQLGWRVPSVGSARIVLRPSEGKLKQIVDSSGTESIHVLAGARGTPLGRQAALACRTAGRSMGLITEAPDPRGPKGLLRWLKYSFERVTLGKHFDFIMAMGQKAVRWFKLCGYPESRIFPFAYVTECLSNSYTADSGKAFRFIFVGQLIRRKGVDLLLRALARVQSVELSVVGNGPDRERLQRLASQCGIADRTFWHGVMDSSEVHTRLSAGDVLVLPSREDGWGAVVNESLMAGTPVICSAACGASELIRHPWLGTVFEANQISSLSAALTKWSGPGKLSLAQRQRIQSWAQCIGAPTVARYMEDILSCVYNRGARPLAPWRV